MNLQRTALMATMALAFTAVATQPGIAQRDPRPDAPVLRGPPSAAMGGDSAAGRTLQSACLRDYRARCSGHDISPAIAAGCLSQNYINLSGACRAALDAYNGRTDDEPE